MGEYSIGDAIQQFLNRSRIKGDIQALQIEEVWEKVMGKTVARYTEKLQIIDQKLIIRTSVAPLRQELLYQKEKIIQRVNEAMGREVVREVEVK
ncbi:MAG: DUF721 domain-containing protein [Chitinophagaceae bacterium]|jgi:hypothetical protein